MVGMGVIHTCYNKSNNTECIRKYEKKKYSFSQVSEYRTLTVRCGFFQIYMSFSAILKAIRGMTLKAERNNQYPGETESLAVRLSKQL